jgi:hypothetical protein
MKPGLYKKLPIAIAFLLFLQKPALSEMDGFLSSMEAKLEKLISKKEEIERRRQMLEKEKDAVSWRIREREEAQMREYGLIRAILLNRDMSKLHKISQELQSLEEQEEELLPQISGICQRLIEGYNKEIEGFIKGAGNIPPQQKEKEMARIYSMQKKKERCMSLLKDVEMKIQEKPSVLSIKAIQDPELLERRKQELLAEINRLDSILRAIERERYLKSSLLKIMESGWEESSRIQAIKRSTSTRTVKPTTTPTTEEKPTTTKPEPKDFRDVGVLSTKETPPTLETKTEPPSAEETTITEVKKSLASDLARWRSELSKEGEKVQDIKERQRYLKRQLEEVERKLKEIKGKRGEVAEDLAVAANL